MNQYQRVWLLVGIGLLLQSTLICTVRADAINEANPTAHTSESGDCYLQLEPRHPDLESRDLPVCKAVLRNLNKLCDTLPQYYRWQIHPTTTDIAKPAWVAVDVRSNLELVKQTYLASALPAYRESVWSKSGSELVNSEAADRLRLWRAELGGSLEGALETVYMLENASPCGYPLVTNQPRLMFSEHGSKVPSKLVMPLSYWGTEDLFSFSSRWFLIGLAPADKLLAVKELMRPQVGSDSPVAVVTRCRIQHVNDVQRSE